MTKFTLDIGLIDKITRKQEMSLLEARNIVEKIVSSYNHPYHITKKKKVTTKKDGSNFEEDLLGLEYIGIKKETLLEILESIKASLNLEGIWLYESTGEENWEDC